MINIAIVKDDKVAADLLGGFAKKYGEENNLQIGVSVFGNSLDFLDSYRPVYDLVFMDILLPDSNGFETAKRLRQIDKTVLLIFVTNLQQFAVKGYEVDAIDFIIKPVYYRGFCLKMDKAVNLIKQKDTREIIIKRSAGIIKVPLKSVYYVEVIGHKIIFHTSGGEIDSGGSLAELEKRLKEDDFLRCNNCYLVNLKHIRSIDKYDITMSNGDLLRISQTKKKSFMSAFAKWLGKGNYL